MSESQKPDRLVDMVVVGAGFAGLYMIHKAHEERLSVVCFEAGDGVGGTWYWNRYPGARVDIECVEYSYSFSKELEQEWDWSERYAGQPELERYANHVADRFNLRDKIHFGTRVVSAIFDDATCRWMVRTNKGDVISARYCIMATGLISAPVEPSFEDLESFEGEQLMTSRWPQQEPKFAGKRVAVIGTGSSGIQVITEVAKEAAALYVIQRTPSYTIPLQNHTVNPENVTKLKEHYSDLRELEFKSFAGFTLVHSELAPLPSQSALEVSDEERHQEYENRWASGGLSPYYAYTDTLLNEQSNETLAEFARERMRERVRNPAIADKLCPDYQILTRRLSPETNYLEVFNQPNVELVDVNESPIEHFTAKGIVVGGEEIELDVVIFATGFDVMTGAMDRIDIRGRDERTLKDRWSEGLTSYLGMMTHGFPNLFWINGPHSPFFNPILLAEYQSDFICSLFEQIRASNAQVLEADEEAERQYVELTNQIGNMTLFPNSNNYYMGDNIPGKPRNVVFFFGGFPLYREQCAAAGDGLGGFSVS